MFTYFLEVPQNPLLQTNNTKSIKCIRIAIDNNYHKYGYPNAQGLSAEHYSKYYAH